jgi:NAD(P) transhydrogenase subunit beta
VVGGFIGAVSFSGSLIAFGKLQGLIKRSRALRGQQILNLLILLAAVVRRSWSPAHQRAAGHGHGILRALPCCSGVAMTLPIGGADMPVVISLYNALTGLAVGFEGFVLDNAAMIIAGTVVGSAGTLLTQLMAKAMNRSLGNVLFSASATPAAPRPGGHRQHEAHRSLRCRRHDGLRRKVIIVPGYGMAVAQAQHKVWELCAAAHRSRRDRAFAIHPVAGRMPGHMNVLLAEAGVPYDLISDLDEINAEFETADVALIIGANDVVNPVPAQRQVQPDLRHAHPERRQGEECHRHQARPGRRASPASRTRCSTSTTPACCTATRRAGQS